MALMEEYSNEVQRRNFLAEYLRPKHPVQLAVPNSAYVGSDTCKKCHKAEHKLWAASGHAHAYKTLEDARRPSLRQFDGECIVCHTIGFAHPGGYADPAKKADPAHNLKLLNVGC